MVEPVCDLATLIETRLLGVAPGDQDLVLEDDDWRTIIAALRERDRLREALLKCRSQFDFYVSAHMAKQPPDMGKAATNQEFVELIDAALEGQSNV